MALARRHEDSMPKKAAKAATRKAATTLPPKAARATTRYGKKRWHDMDTGQQTAVVAAGVVQVTMAAAAWIDLARRPAEKVRGPKALWAAVIAVNFVGPALYFVAGRRAGSDPSPDSRTAEVGSSDEQSSDTRDEPALTGS